MIVHFSDVRQQLFLAALENGAGTEKRAALQTKVTIAEVKTWLSDPDFSLAVEMAKEKFVEVEQQHLDDIEQSIFAAAKGEDHRLGLDVLRARRPARWNPAVKLEVGELRHKFLGFAGEPLHDEKEILESPGLPELGEDGAAEEQD